MLCQNCKKKEAVYHSTLIVNGQSQSSHLCEDCAVKEGKMTSQSEMFDTFFKGIGDIFSDSFMNNLFCPSCNSTFADFKNRNFLGCEDCFDVFKNDIEALVKEEEEDDDKIEFSTPKKSADELKLERLKESLQKAIKEERFEDCADINKQIKKLQNKIDNK